MKVFDYEDMPDEELRSWLGYILEDLKKERGKGFRNVQALKEGAIVTAIKRIQKLAETSEMLEAADHVGGWLDREKGTTWSVRNGPYQDGKFVWTTDIDERQITQWHDSALEAWREVKKEQK